MGQKGGSLQQQPYSGGTHPVLTQYSSAIPAHRSEAARLCSTQYPGAVLISQYLGQTASHTWVRWAWTRLDRNSTCNEE